MVGRLTGVDFQIDKGASALEDRALRHAARQAVTPEIARRLGRLAAGGEDFLGVFRIAPLSRSEAEEMPRAIRSAAVLRGIRGERPSPGQRLEEGAADGLQVRDAGEMAPEDREVLTLEGLPPEDRAGWADAFVATGASQCGYCSPGIVMKAEALLARNGDPSRDEVAKALAGNLCRCTGYDKIVRAVQDAARVMKGA